ncbi:hypothetical protein [Limnofasciculus baicalensis]|uniref:Type I restriction enzyme R protein N-terminal domain-containing protein n=1 Tax=Limnofasciculus baicalensis BBK-W-15 TaxID=2699891 RepID=A0AAE3KMD7_9CYAN|nr:hypothetical protein [Limnofasciculus baicalensis]MCP2727543.1 hypothetical protein [Limnofasciculus baicalensis BBK-W-15]
MSKATILEPGKSYTFRNYFEMTYEPDDILAEFGFSLKRSSLELPKSNTNLDQLTELKNSIQRRLPYVSLTSEAARREILIAPIVLALIDYTQAQLRIEYAINVSEQLKGSLDYYLHTQHNLLVIEAKNADLARGFTQLAVELIAMDQWTTSDETLLYGVVSTGDVWQFGVLNREEKQVQQDLNLYRVPADLNDLFSSLIAILNNSG